MATMTYKEQLQHPNWQRKRLEVLEAAGFACEECGDKETMLHVHHKRYVKGRKAWEYEADELQVLCAPCHERGHADREFLEEMLAGPNVNLASVIGLVAGYLDGDCALDIELANKAACMSGFTYDLGIFASIVSGAGWDQMAPAARSLAKTFTPQQRDAIERWEGN